ncbi:hypothetical protein L0128_09715 [candidate division KSB1 bacterium]|nr:hypothetical protein [candidate division KSB1 bacterium]
MLRHLPLQHPKPNATELIEIILGQRPELRVPLIEYIVDDFLLKPITQDVLGRQWVTPQGDRQTWAGYLDNFIEFWYRMGYDFVRFEIGLTFTERHLVAADPVRGANRDRYWVDQHQGNIANWDDFERYPWPKIETMDFYPLEYINNHLPDGMGFLTCHAAGVLEHLSAIMSYEGLSLALYDNPALVQAVVDKVGELLFKYYEHLLDLDRVIAIFQGDDMGFRTGTLIGPDALRTYTLPWHQRLAALTHAHQRPYFLHSCGNLETILEDLINTVKIDAKHSYEDAILPVQEFQARYGQRIGVLGGLDLNILSGANPAAVRQKTRKLIEICGDRGRYAIGSGNSVPSYVPLENYLAMVDEAHDCNA